MYPVRAWSENEATDRHLREADVPIIHSETWIAVCNMDSIVICIATNIKRKDDLEFDSVVFFQLKQNGLNNLSRTFDQWSKGFDPKANKTLLFVGVVLSART